MQERLEVGEEFVLVEKIYGDDDNDWPENDPDDPEAQDTIKELAKLGFKHYIELTQDQIGDKNLFDARIYTQKEISMEEAQRWHTVADIYSWELFSNPNLLESSQVTQIVSGKDLGFDNYTDDSDYFIRAIIFKVLDTEKEI